VVGVEFSVLFLAVPVGAWCVGGSMVASNYADLRDKGLPVVKVGSPGGRLRICYVITATHAVFGLVLWLQVARLEEEYGTLEGNVRTALTWVGVAFAWAAVVAIVSQASIIRSRLGQFVSEGFGRVFILAAPSSTLTIFGLVVVLSALGRISNVLATGIVLTADQTRQITLAALGFALSASVALIGVVWSAKVQDLSAPKDFLHALSRIEIGIAALLVGLLWALLTLWAT
jgi:hypothetical protein